MSEKSAIEWTMSTWNPVLGCSKVSAGCANCYAIREAWKKRNHPSQKVRDAYEGLVRQLPDGSLNWTGKVACLPDRLEAPLHWKQGRRIFVNSMSDLFHPDVPFTFVAQVWDTMFEATQHQFQILTKRPERLYEFAHWMDKSEFRAIDYPNVWLGVSVEDQRAADERIPWLLRVPAAVRFLSCEPLLGPIDLEKLHRLDYSTSAIGEEVYPLAGLRAIPDCDWEAARVDWVITGGESGKGARATHPEWARSLREQCASQDVPFFFKEWGEWLPADQLGSEPRKTENKPTHEFGDGMFALRLGRFKTGRELDGREWNEYPTPRRAS